MQSGPIGAPLTAMSAVGRRTIVSAPLTSPCARSTRATGRVPFGRPYCSTRTLTADRGGKGPSPTALYGGGAGRKIPVPCSHRGWRRYTLTRVSAGEFSGSLMLSRPKDVARGFVLGPLTEVGA